MLDAEFCSHALDTPDNPPIGWCDHLTSVSYSSGNAVVGLSTNGVDPILAAQGNSMSDAESACDIFTRVFLDTGDSLRSLRILVGGVPAETKTAGSPCGPA